MTSTAIIKMIADKTEYTQKDIKAFLAVAEPVLLEALKAGKSFKIMDVTVSLVDVAERTARNLQTGEMMTVPAHKKVSFKPSKALKETVK